ncbi:ATP-dependent helicase [Phocoenobacter skyensis]|uniref:DNA 3'-5' helicase II n=1 Tax=Phocoenobacter skyensis TaxID=97481 RepID=A0ABT9JJT2_9PAST|nr:ATP-dependent helicase [Pasteurella skyensis]MDP8079115.1 ATP-dependent helicase [Pasteurella skyensis]MDP8085065.1 ATP-dependent helicase [Pasteurella skyensis]
MTISLEGVDKEIYSYACNSKSFLLLAGAGSGKTRTMVNVLQAIKENKREDFLKKGQKVAVITYTNAACDEIKHRLGYDSAFAVSTIHSFAWELIQSFTSDIKYWKTDDLTNKIDDLDNKINKARNETTRTNYQRKKERKLRELNNLANVKKFIYSPTELLLGLGALTHSDVIKLCTHFLNEHSLMRKILVNQFPILFIDECQDTQKDLLKAIIKTQEKESNNFSVGLFGDLMQRIYSDGYAQLRDNLPSSWELPQKEENYRSPKRVVTLINKIRENEDEFQQFPRHPEQGTVRLFIAPNNKDRTEIEKLVKKMAKVCDDEKWLSDANNVETLALEHRMIARRAGFANFYEPLSRNNSLRDGLLNGTGKNVNFLQKVLIPFVESIKSKDDFSLMRILEKNNPQIKKEQGSNFLIILQEIKSKIDELVSLEKFISSDISIKNIIKFIYEKQLLILPDELERAITLKDNEETDEIISLWRDSFNASFKQLICYFKYNNGELGYSTHQGVKGLEYPRVMAILDDEEAGGFLFSYEKLSGTRELSATDIRNQEEGRDSVLSRTSRLFYVICSRAEKSLAIVMYTENPYVVKEHVISHNWFLEEEVERC